MSGNRLFTEYERGVLYACGFLAFANADVHAEELLATVGVYSASDLVGRLCPEYDAKRIRALFRRLGK